MAEAPGADDRAVDAAIAAAAARLAAAKRIVAFTGAGLSAASGLATFRGGDADALWSRFDPARLATPEAFERTPGLVLAWYAWRRARARAASPNAAHRALAARPDVVQVTQNVDDLLERAGARHVVHLHGTLARDRCHAGCGHERAAPDPGDVAFHPDDPATHPPVEPCPSCGAPLRPGVVWFGEALPDQAWTDARVACSLCDAMLVVGSSGSVHPAAGLVALAAAHGATTIVVDPGATCFDREADVVVRASAATVLPRLLPPR